ncbi:DUF4382 domain-containing protein [uncultured Christiangramia sp.]|uniref:DUF4382 domain-containing protein n=1 Tax=Christiangramia sp. 3-2217-3z TaxID=3417564 RepID=UPI0025F848C2|nr:DUF4382 domain-containing protein [uncultured Christiangramia sp.]|tara:strand:- start:1602 stop:2450 length:849 start_codon:yes stop_codon:yes gene_type:complete
MKYLSVSFKSLLVATLISVGLVSCNDDDSDGSSSEMANLSIRMTDAPGDYDAVFIDVQGIEIQLEADDDLDATDDDGTEGSEWVTVEDVNTGIYDLLELTGGVSQLLADTEIEAGYVGQMRLILGPDNTVVVDGETKALNTPSAQQSGLKLQLNQRLEGGENYAFLLDFDVEQSIVETGNGGYNLKPVIRLSAEANAGMVVGTTVVPAALSSDVQSLVVLTGNGITVSAYTNNDGDFALNGVPAGTYDVKITPQISSGLTVYTVSDVEVRPNETTDLGEIEL